MSAGRRKLAAKSRPRPALISPQQALATVLASVRPLPARRVALGEALGCYLAQDVRSDRDQPPADRSAMDGYAVVAADLRRAPTSLPLVGEAAAGSAARLRVRRGTCAGILTGGNVPGGADAVVPIEQTRREGAHVVFLAAARAGDHIRRRGEEASRGQVLLARGALLGPAQIGVCAMVGKAHVRVYSRPTVAVIVTGAEVRDVGDRVAAHQLRDSNGPALLGALAECGFRGAVRSLAPDGPRAIAAMLKHALRACNVVIVTGGVSVGRYDFVPDAVRRAGGTVRFHGVRMKPGKPQLYATLGGNRHVFALPGNPVSMLTGFHELVHPALRRLCGAAKGLCRPSGRLPLAEGVRSKGERTYFVLARVIRAERGPAALPIRSAGSADIIAACAADGVIVIPESITRIPAGAMVEFHTWKTSP